MLASYIKQNMHFFVAKVNLDRMEAAGHRFLRPLQVRYETKKFMLPLRLGTVNADGPQDLIVLRADAQRARRDHELPHGEAADRHRRAALRQGRVRQILHRDVRPRGRARGPARGVPRICLGLGSCDPCVGGAAGGERELGSTLGARCGGGGGGFVTRLHVRYDAAHFPEDLSFMETRDRANFQGRYVLRHPWRGAANCSAGERYSASLAPRFAREADTLADLTGWNPERISARMSETGQAIGVPASGSGDFIDRILRGGR